MTNNEVIQWVERLFTCPPDSINENTTKDEIPNWDSMGILSLMVGLFEDFQVEMSDDELVSLQSVGDIVQLLKNNGKIE